MHDGFEWFLIAITRDVIGSASMLELTFCLLAIVGLVMSSRSLGPTVPKLFGEDYRGAHPTVQRRVRKRIRDALGVYIRKIGFLIVGYAAVNMPAAPVADDRYPTGLALGLVFIVIQLYDVAALIIDDVEWTATVAEFRRDPMLLSKIMGNEAIEAIARVGRGLVHATASYRQTAEGIVELIETDSSCAPALKADVLKMAVGLQTAGADIAAMHRRLKEMTPTGSRRVGSEGEGSRDGS